MTAADARLSALRAELAGLPEKIGAARRAGDVGEWLTLQNREEDLPAEIAAAEVEVLTAQAEAAWARAERLAAAEPALRQALEDAQAEVSALEDRAPVVRAAAARAHLSTKPRIEDITTGADLDVALTQAYADRTAATAALEEAVEATMVALFDAEECEGQLKARGVRRPDVTEGLRATPWPTTDGTTVQPKAFGPLADKVRCLGRGGDWRSVHLPAGTVLPRWVAHRLPHLVTSPDEVEARRRRVAAREQAEADANEARRRRAHEDPRGPALVRDGKQDGRLLHLTGALR